MDKILQETLNDIRNISQNSREKFFKISDKIIDIILNGFSTMALDDYTVYPIGEYDYETNLEEIAPFKIVFEYSCTEEKIQNRINYLKLSAKKSKSIKNSILLSGAEELSSDVLINSEIAQIIENLLKKSEIKFSTTIKQNSVFARYIQDEKIYDFVIIVAYKLNPSVDDITFKYKAINYTLNYEKYFENMQIKNVETRGKYFDLILLYRLIELALISEEKIDYKTMSEFNLYEDLFYNVPNAMMVKSIYESTVNSANFLNNADLNKFVNCEGKKLINGKTDYDRYSTFIDLIIYNVKEYFNELKND